MATIKSYTDIEQSKKLAEILPIDSADMVHFGIHRGIDGKYHLSGTNTEDDVIPIYKNICTKVFVKITSSDITCQLPCWSLAALRNLLPPAIKLNKDLYLFESHNTFDNSWVYRYYNENDTSYLYHKNINEVDACVAMIEELNEHKML